MYLQIGGSRYSVRRRIVYEDAVVYLSVTPKPVEVAGMIQLCRDDGFVLAEDDAGAYARHTYAGTRLTLTNAAEVSPQPKPTPEPQATRAEALAAVSFARMMLPSVQSSMGADDTIIDNLGRYGWQAAVIAILGIAGSIVAARAAKRILGKGGER